MWLLPWLAAAADEPLVRDVQTAFGPTHTVAIDTAEGTWTSVTVHGEQVVFDLLGDLWTVPLAGGDARRLTEGLAFDVEPRITPDGTTILFTSDRGGNEGVWRMPLAGGAPTAIRTDPTHRFTEATPDPLDPRFIIARRREVDRSSIGTTRLFHLAIDGGDGKPLTGEGQLAGEPALHGHFIYYSTNGARYSYGQNPTQGLWSIHRIDRRTGEDRIVIQGAGGASRPMVHPDGRRLVFVQRYETKTRLMALDLDTQQRRVLWDDLSPDEMEGFALHGTYPRMDWTDAGELVLWAHGSLWRLDTATGARAEIPFRVRGDWTLHTVARPPGAIDDRIVAKVVRTPKMAPDGRVVFSALGALWIADSDGKVARVGDGMAFTPTWSADGSQLAYVGWDDVAGGSLRVRDAKGREEVLPLQGRLSNPAFSEDASTIVVLRGAGGHTDVDLAAEPYFEVWVLERAAGRKAGWTARHVRDIDSRAGDAFTPRGPSLFVREGRIWMMEDVPVDRDAPKARLVSVRLDGSDPRTHVELPPTDELALSPDGRWLAYKHDHQLHLAPVPPLADHADVAQLPTRRVTNVVGDWLSWSPDSRRVLWMEGTELKSLAVDGLLATPDTREALGDLPGVVSQPLRVTVPRARPSGSVFLRRCDRIATMGPSGVLEGADLVITSDRIAAVGVGLTPPDGATVIDCAGKTALPGLIDVHAHLHFSAADLLPNQPWRYQVALDYGVTTVHDPSAFTDEVFTQAQRVEAGMAEGPRVYSTGLILYGAKAGGAADTPDLLTARAHVRRLQAVGARSVKVYQQAQRVRRQYYAQVCREEGVLCIPEGGGDLWMDLSMVVDGYHAVEHALPTAPLHADVRQLIVGAARAGDGYGTFYTPTLQVAYSGVPGKHWFEAVHDPYRDPLLRRHTPEPWLQQAFWRREVLVREEDWRYRWVAADAARLAAEGAHVTLGAHGELQGLGVHWELWALGGPGAMSPERALAAATIEGARYLGLDAHLGSLEPGKLADVLIVEGDPLSRLTDSTNVRHVIRNGVPVR